MTAKVRANQNYINGLFVEGLWISTPSEVQQAAANHFKTLFSSLNWPKLQMLDFNFINVSRSDLNMLEIKVEMKEICEAIWHYEGSKAPGPDGLKFKFFKKAWSFCKE